MPTRVTVRKDLENAPAFKGLSSLQRGSVVDMAVDAARCAVSQVEYGIPLPGKVTVDFGRYEETAGSSDTKKITVDVGQILEGGLSFDAVVGLIGHELSHVSDFYTGNYYRYFGWLGLAIIEGKADQIGIEIGGQDYVNSFIDDSLFGIEELPEKIVEVSHMTRRQRLKPSLYNSYTFGLDLVGEIMRRNNMAIYEIHTHDMGFFEEQTDLICEGVPA